MASRYDSLSGSNNFTPTITTRSESGGSTTSQRESVNSRETALSELIRNITSNEQTTSTTNTDTLIREFQKQLFDVDYMSEAGRDAMNQTLAQLLAGGTEEQRRIQAERLETLDRIRANQEQFNRRNALKDARGMMSAMMRQGMEQGMPSILLAQSGAGTSGNALSALLTQDLAARSAEGAAIAGTNAVANYGGILASLLGQEVQAGANLEDLVTQSLLNALQIDKGSMQRGEVLTESERREKGQSTTNSNTRSTSRETGTEKTVTNRDASSSSQGSSNSWNNAISQQQEWKPQTIVNYNSTRR